MWLLRPGFILFARNRRVGQETKRLQTLCRPAMGGTSVREEVEWDERTSRDKTGKEGMLSTLRWCASARTAYSSSTLSSSCHHRGDPSGTMTHSPLSEIRGAIDLSRATNRLVASPISRMAITTRGIRRWSDNEPLSKFYIPALLSKVPYNAEDIAHFLGIGPCQFTVQIYVLLYLSSYR